jgi:ornithine decarboxylase
MIVERIGHLCDYILFDEAWAGFMKFHPLYEGRFAMGLSKLDAKSPGIVATQTTHKQLASFSQASQIHLRDRHIRGQRRRVEHRRFNEGFMLHASTSPFYPLFASLDVGAQMMKGRSGEVLWDDTIRLGIELRKKLRAIRAEFEEKDPACQWFFDPFVPDRVSIPDAAREGTAHDVAWESVSTDQLARHAQFWELSPGAAWHGFAQGEKGFAIIDPAKLTLLTPEFDRQTGAYEAHGVPAPIVAQYLRENRVVPEKNDLNSLLFCSRRASNPARRGRSSARLSPSNASTTTMRRSRTSCQNLSRGARPVTEACACGIFARTCMLSSVMPMSVPCRKRSFLPIIFPRWS